MAGPSVSSKMDCSALLLGADRGGCSLPEEGKKQARETSPVSASKIAPADLDDQCSRHEVGNMSAAST